MSETLLLIRHLCLLACAITCAYTDMARDKLYNVVTVGGLLVGLALALLLDGQAAGDKHFFFDAVLAAFAGGGLLFLIYLTGGMGAGDVKFIAAVGALSGSWQFIFHALVFSALIGAAIAIGVLIWQGRLFQGMRDSARVLFTFRHKQREGRSVTTIPYGVAIAGGTVWAWLETFVLKA